MSIIKLLLLIAICCLLVGCGSGDLTPAALSVMQLALLATAVLCVSAIMIGGTL